MITENANASIQMQKSIQLALISLKQNDLSDKKVQNQLAVYFSSVENLVKKDLKLSKCLYSLYSFASEEFSKQGEEAIAGLLFIKAKLANDDSDYFDFDFDYIGYFERHADIKNVNYLIALHQKKKKSSFEKLITSQTMKKDVNLYKDLLGTIAFRNNDLESAAKVFKSMPRDFWSKSEIFKKLLNENPFHPKVLVKPKERIYNYNFNKADFVSKIIQLKKQNTAASNMQLANAYYNTSYFGNSWAMIAYDKFSVYNHRYEYRDNNQELKAKYQNGNYYNLTTARMYYQKALKMAKTNEEKALASLMIFECNYYRYNFSGFNSYEMNYFPVYNFIQTHYPFYYEFYYRDHFDTEKNEKFKGIEELSNFYSIYKSTETFKKYDCPLLREFLN